MGTNTRARWRLFSTTAVALLTTVVIGATASCGGPRYPVLISNVGDHLMLEGLAWVDVHTLYYTTADPDASDAPPKLWASVDGARRLIYSFKESSLHPAEPCGDPYFFGINAKNVNELVALVYCYGGDGTLLVSIGTDGRITASEPAADAHALGWRPGTDRGAVVVGPLKCRTVVPVTGAKVSWWSSPRPPWNLNDTGDGSSCARRGYISDVGVFPGGSVVLISAEYYGPIDAPETLFEVDAEGSTVTERASGFTGVWDMAVVGDDVVVSGKHDGKAGLWRWVRATGAVQSLAEGSFTRIAARPDGGAVAAGRAHGDGVEVVEIALPSS